MGGAAITTLAITKINRINIPVPAIVLQCLIRRHRRKNRTALVQQTIDQTQTQFDRLMAEYFEQGSRIHQYLSMKNI